MSTYVPLGMFVIVLLKSFIYLMSFSVCVLNQLLRKLCLNLPTSFIARLFPLNRLGTLAENHLAVYVQVYFWALYSILLVQMSVLLLLLYCFDYCTFLVSFEIRKYKSFYFVLFLKDCFHYSGSLESLSKFGMALAGVAQWIEHQPVSQKVTDLIPGQGTCLGCRPGPQLGGARGTWSMFLSHISVSLFLFLPPFPSL